MYEVLRSIVIPSIALCVVNVLGFFNVVPVFVQLLLSSTCCLYIGCILSIKMKRGAGGALQNYSKILGEDEETIDMKEAIKFPFVASAFLFGFYLLFKYLDKDILNAIISVQFCLATVFSLTSMVLEACPFPASMRTVWKKITIHKYITYILDVKELQLSMAFFICLATCSFPIIVYYITKHWFINNVFAILFTIVALKSINLSSFKVGFVMLWALFFYDIFWVYGTDVMLTVAKNLSIPIKILFPYVNGEGEQQYSLLGLGDIVIPGLFISICLKFDLDNCFSSSTPKQTKDISLRYFNASYVGYVLGIGITFFVMNVFNAAQPALLYLVPCCTLSVLAVSYIKGEAKALIYYESGMKKEEKQKLVKEGEKQQEKLVKEGEKQKLVKEE